MAFEHKHYCVCNACIAWLLAGLTLAGCLPKERAMQPNKPSVLPAQLQETIVSLVAKHKYQEAVSLLQNTSIDAQVQFAVAASDWRWYAVYEDTLVVPGINENVDDPASVWILPGTSDAILDVEWQATASRFAGDYNRKLRAAIQQRNDVVE